MAVLADEFALRLLAERQHQSVPAVGVLDGYMSAADG